MKETVTGEISPTPHSSFIIHHWSFKGQTSLIPSGISIRNPFQGYIDEVRIYNRALTAAEVNDVFQKNR